MASVSIICNLVKTTTINVANNYAESKGNSQQDVDYAAVATYPMGTY